MIAMMRGGHALRRCLAIFGLVIASAGCAMPPRSGAVRSAAVGTFGTELPAEARETRVRPTDRLTVRVLFEPELSSPDVRVDASGIVSLPVVGDIKAAGSTTRELASLIQSKLQLYVKEPQVTVSVLSTAGDHVIVEGNVIDPGVFDIAGSAGLLEMLARAKSPNRTAALDQVVVFRQIDGRRVGAVFNVNRIRRGLNEEPRLYPGDTVVVGFSFLKGAYRDFLIVAPAAFSIFRLY